MNDLTMNIVGFAAVNKDLQINLIDSVTRKSIRTVTPFLDGTARFPQVAAGSYELQVIHPNMTLPVVTRPVHVLPVGETNITVLIDPTKFKNSAIEDIPEANLRPVIDLSESVAATVSPLANKAPGEAIRSSDWNALAGAVRDLANSNVQLARLVSPVGHDHPELIKKIEEMSGNFSTLLDTMSQALAELQRQLQTLRLRQQVEEVLDTLPVNQAKKDDFLSLLAGLEGKITASPGVYNREMRFVANQLGGKIEVLVEEHRDALPDLALSAPVIQVATSIDLLKASSATNYANELSQNRRIDRVLGGSALALKGRGL
ncbi:MAG: hypothetical protein V4574_10505 [Pseudomonadota bacterium]